MADQGIPRPNIVVVFPDQMQAAAMGCAGHPDVRTPHLDQLAAQGVRFSRAVANCPVCTPSRGTILTGRYPLAHGACSNDLPLRQDVPTFGDIFSSAGWRTGYVGKWHLDGIPRSRFTPPGPRRHGFEYWAAWNCSHQYFRAQYFRDDPEPIAVEGYEPHAQTDLALDFVRLHRDEPFCLFLSWGPPHPPYAQVPAEDRAAYDPAALTPRGNMRDPDRRTVADYYAAITALDREMGRLLGALETLELRRRTLVVFTSDHGDMLFSHGMREKQKPWDESILVPLIFSQPGGLPAGRVSPTLFSTADLLPTLLSLAGVPAPAGIQGQDLAAAVRGEPDAGGPHSAFLLNAVPVDSAADVLQGEWRGVRTGRYTYAERLSGPWLLYDNEVDPLQSRNLVDAPEHGQLQAELRSELQRWLRRTQDPFLAWPEHIRRLGLTELWNVRERAMHPDRPRLVVD